jgi:hypothetical protein
MTCLKRAPVRDVYHTWLKGSRIRDSVESFPREDILAREDNLLRRRLKLAGFPLEKTINQFDSTVAQS